MINPNNLLVPLDVPSDKKELFLTNYLKATHQTGRLMLFAGDQKIEHLNNDFYGEGIAGDDADPKHLFEIASRAKIGVFATQMGLIAHYGNSYPKIPYLIKLNSKTNLVKTAQADPQSTAMLNVEQVEDFRKNSGLDILGVGYTIYLGSIYENEMIKEAAQIIYQAHKNGLISVIWAYPRGTAVKDEKDPHLIAGAAGVAACLGADFVKVNYPKKEGVESKEALKEAVVAAGQTKVICAGGSTTDVPKFLSTLYDQIHVSGAYGNATGRNIHQKPIDEAIRFSNAIYTITVENKTVNQALKIYQK